MFKGRIGEIIMKKILSVLLIMCCLTVFCACGASTPDTSSANQIVYGEKYISADEILSPKSEQAYYIINKNSIKYYNYYQYSGSVQHCTITFKYEIMDEGTLAYFFDSIEIYDDDNTTNKDKPGTSHGILLFSKNVISTQSGNLFIRESYLENELKNFGK